MERVSEEQFRIYFDEVSKKFVTGARDLEADKLLMYFNPVTSVTYTFTKPGHPAHPAWVSRLVVTAEEKLTTSQIGFYAGSYAEYEKLFKSIQTATELLKRSLKN